MKIAYVTTYDSSDARSWSGLGLTIRTALENAGAEIVPIGPLTHKYGRLFGVKSALHALTSECRYESDREPRLLRHYARQVEARLATSSCDVILSPGTLPVTHLETKKPIVIWTDAVFDAMVDFYPSFTNLCGESLRNGHAAEQSALGRCSRALFSSEWAATAAREHYLVSSEKVSCVPFGANLCSGFGMAELVNRVEVRAGLPLRLLFVGADWDRKRGDLAIAVAAELNRRGVAAELHVVGPAPERDMPGFVHLHGSLRRDNPADQATLFELFAQSHFLLLPSIAECCAVVLAEAASFGVPGIATDVGGNGTAVVDGVTGVLLDVNAPPGAYADSIMRIVGVPEVYRQTSIAAFEHFTRHLSWTVAGATAMDILEQVLAE